MASYRKLTKVSGEVCWEARINRRGQAVLSKRFEFKGDAQAWAREIETGLDKNIKPGRKTTSSLVVFLVVDEYLKVKPATSKQAGAFARVKQDLGTLAVSKLTHKHVRDWLKSLETTPVPARGPKGQAKAKPYAASTRRKFYYALQEALTWHAREKGYYLASDLFEGHSIPSPWVAPRENRVSPAQLTALKKAVSKSSLRMDVPVAELQNLLEFAVQTAMRLQEIVFARFEDLRNEGRVLFLPAAHTKGKKARTVPLTAQALKIISSQRDLTKNTGNTRIFGHIKNPADVSEMFGHLRTLAKCSELTFHDLRHEGISRLCETANITGYSVPELMLITGHTSVSTFNRYVNLMPSNLADKIAKMPEY